MTFDFGSARVFSTATFETYFYCHKDIFIPLFGVLCHFQHCLSHIMMGSLVGRRNQYIQLVKALYCKLSTISKQLPDFPYKVPGLNCRPQRWEVGELPLHHRGSITEIYGLLQLFSIYTFYLTVLFPLKATVQLIVYYFITFSLPINTVAIELFCFCTLSLNTFCNALPAPLHSKFYI